ncbi:hypothetical protein HPB52_003277 [Rhipicephalus sanguineus]|uniref:Nose resistant-to-fluoxetine protein N-terminal domain-containing protein n=1 Tax=Rhipicephalus sanguineus TaxID=34632 RepID=A0A9D4QGM0_RHISA|nr:hypothetical protein HPB52_003277 [Rhipicephalus sanguineus]
MDASGKLPEGLLEGRMASIGSYDECLDLVAEYKTQELYRGKYCTVFLSSGHNVQEMFNNETDASAHLSTLLRHPKRMTRIVYRVSPQSRKFRLGVCVPSVCTLDDVQNVVAHSCLTNCLLSFSFARNLRRLTDPVEPPELGAAQGVQAISMAWLICGHTYFLTENTHMFISAAYQEYAQSGLFLAYKCELYSYKSVFSILLQKYFRNAKIGYSSVLGFALAGCVVTGAITFAKDLPPGSIFEPNYREVERLSTWIYHKPYTHLGSFCVGLGLGCLLSQFDKNRLSKLAYAMGWVASLTTTSVLFHCGFGWSLERASPAGASLYAALHRTLWALAVAWVLYACCTLHARLLNEWLSWGPLKVVGRLSYCMLLVHPLVIVSQKSQNRHITFFSHFDMMHLFFGHYAVTLVLSFLVHLGVEEPFAQLGELLGSCEVTCPPRLKQLTQNLYAGVATQLRRRERQQQQQQQQQQQAVSNRKEPSEGAKKAQQPSQQQQLDNHHTEIAIDVDVGRQLENGTEVAVIKENGRDTSHVVRDGHRDSAGSPEAAV